MTQLNKAALILMLLEPELAGEILKRVGRSEAQRLLRAVAAISRVESEEINTVAREFLESLRSQSGQRPLRGGGEHARHIMRHAAGIVTEDDAFWSTMGSGSLCAEIQKELSELSARQLADWAARELPQTTAVMLSLAPPELGAQILRELPAPLRSDVVLSLSETQSVADEALEELLSELRGLNHTSGQQITQIGGVEKLQSLLADLDPQAREQLLENLQTRNPELVEMLRESLLTFEKIAQLQTKDLALVLSGASNSLLAKALYKDPDALQETFMAALSSTRRQDLRDELASLSQLRREDKKNARKWFVEKAKELRESGRILFPWEDEMVS